MEFIDAKHMRSIAEAIDAHKNAPHIEMEFRLGRIIGHKFVTGITENQFLAVERQLGSNPKWSSVIHQEFIDTYFKDGSRMRCYDKGTHVERVMKRKLFVINIPGKTGIDARFSISSETPIDDESGCASYVNVPYKELKQRLQRVHKFWAFDTTRVIKGASSTDKDSDEKVDYHVEVELLDNSRIQQTSAKYVAEYGMLLTNDLIKMIASR